MKILKVQDNKKEHIIKEARRVLEAGGLLVFPTETCYGLGVDATNDKAVKKLLQYKTRRSGQPFSIAVSSMEMAKDYVKVNEIAENIYQNYLPGPITVVSESLKRTASGIDSEYGTLGIRWPNYPLSLEIIKSFGKPITATSANLSYQAKPYCIEALLKNCPLKNQALIDLIIDAGPLKKRQSSAVLDTTLNNLNIMRPGQIDLRKDLKLKTASLTARSKKEADTIQLAKMTLLKYFKQRQKQALLFFLIGDLGAGKTHFSKGLAQGLGIKSIVKSPTFTILNEYNYQATAKFVHLDTWRLENSLDLQALELGKYIQAGNVISIEWADKFLQDLKAQAKAAKIITVKLKYLDENTRDIEIYD